MHALIWLEHIVMTLPPCGTVFAQSRNFVSGTAAPGQLSTMQLKNDSSVDAPWRQPSVVVHVAVPVPMYVAAVPWSWKFPLVPQVSNLVSRG